MKAFFITLTMVFCFLPLSYSHFNINASDQTTVCTENHAENAHSNLFEALRKYKPNTGRQAGNYQIRTVVIDAGHGGHDAGCSGAHSHEKDIVLNIALRLGSTIKANFPHINIIYTRDRDVFIPLHRRAKIANDHKADLFISVHCNSIANAAYVRGSETYVLGLHRAADNLEVAKRENASILLEDNYQSNYAGYDPNSTENHIIMSMFQNAFLEQSINFAEKVEHQVKYGAHGKSRGVKQAGFLVLRETAMPSVLIETGYLSNVTDDNYLQSEYGQNQMAMAIFRAFKSYKNEIESGSVNSGAVHQQIVQARERQQNTTIAAATAPQRIVKGPNPSSLIIAAPPHNRPINDHTPALPALKPMVYKVQLASGTDLIDTDQSPWNKVSATVEIRQEGNIYKYLSQGFSNMKEAITYRDKLRTLGFKDAFVVSYQNGRRK